MTKQRRPSKQNSLSHLMECYLGLESMEVTEDLLDLCGASINTHALPRLQLRLQEEEAHILQYEAHGYIRMREKSEQLVAINDSVYLALPTFW